MNFKNRNDAIKLEELTNEYITIDKVCIDYSLTEAVVIKYLVNLDKLYTINHKYYLKQEDLKEILPPENYYRMGVFYAYYDVDYVRRLNELSRKNLIKCVVKLGVRFYEYDSVNTYYRLQGLIDIPDAKPETEINERKQYCEKLKNFDVMPKNFKEKVYNSLNLIPSLRCV